MLYIKPFLSERAINIQVVLIAPFRGKRNKIKLRQPKAGVTLSAKLTKFK